MSGRADGNNAACQRLLKKPLDDCEPRDMARLAGMFIERIVKWMTGRRPAVPDAEHELVVAELTQVGKIMQAWAEFGRWDNSRAPYTPLTPRLRELIECACIEIENSSPVAATDECLRRAALVHELRKAIAPPNPAGVEPGRRSRSRSPGRRSSRSARRRSRPAAGAPPIAGRSPSTLRKVSHAMPSNSASSSRFVRRLRGPASQRRASSRAGRS